ncbi:hypothetical protein JVX98_13425 [Ensifer sp. PDNC004]|uniref:hypothetical protein n=1 Tax=Ensifer sp. PDNC004 TaxID=2811423 RepID=UPI001964424B|nr:hypothetical protein [Ensifer sp. PDNC004]QRY69154.1 hypothetical protein JVX98_13095 [Ensifer sp. PDNC004]QRY69216.1 hypothetical protein JVX98_13425 [Ensifer sp. PDNC004]
MTDIEDDDDPIYDDDDFCDCEEYDADILEGRAHCYRCGRSWWLTDEQMRQEIRWQAEMMECAEESAEGTQND